LIQCVDGFISVCLN